MSMVQKELNAIGNRKETSIVIGEGLPIDVNLEEKVSENINTLSLLQEN